MASAQVLPNTRGALAKKQGHLEAGKRRLEEFRKKKAARIASSGQLPSNDLEIPDRFSSESIIVPDTSDKLVGELVDAFSSNVYDSTTRDSPQVYEGDFVKGLDSASCDDNNRLSFSSLTSNKDEDHGVRGSSHLTKFINDSNGIQQGRRNMLDTQKFEHVSLDAQTGLNPVQANSVAVTEVTNPIFHSQSDSGISENCSRIVDISGTSSSMNVIEYAEPCPELVTGVIGSSSSHDLPNDELFMPNKMDQGHHSNTVRGRISSIINRRLNVEGSSSFMPEHSLMNSTLGMTGPFFQQNQHLFPSGIQGNVSGRSRPSFLDSINVSHISSAVDLPADSLEVEPASTNLITNGREVQQTSSQLPSLKIDRKEPSDNNQKNASIDVKANGHKNASVDVNHSSCKADDFATLEQHIEDLTREKFSLQRALDTSQSLAESLASENSSLTESYNQQGKIVVQLKIDMERLQDEIKAHLRAFESLKVEYVNAQQECNAADERAKILASEVINLEEKVLRVRSNELKLEKQLETANSEIASYRRKLSSFGKESRDFQSTIEALQEEKKMLQSKLQITSIPRSNVSTKKDACTFTDDICFMNDVDSNFPTKSVEDHGSTPMLAGDASSSSFQDIHKNDFHQQTIGSIPLEHLGMIDNINSLLSELTLEKEMLMEALATETSLNSKLKDLNKELSIKLVSQTQRFELLAAQKIANENVHMKQANSGRISETVQYTDEGDEVVERVLGWIMKLFPRGPGKRRSSNRL